MKKSESKKKISHLQKQVRSNQKDIKSLLQRKKLFNRDMVGNFMFTRSGAKRGAWTFVRGNYSVILNSGLKTATNEIIVKNSSLLSFHETEDLKIIQRELFSLNKGLNALPMRKRQKETLSKEKRSAVTEIVDEKTFSFEDIELTFPTEGTKIEGVVCEKRESTLKGNPYLILHVFGPQWEQLGRLIWEKETFPIWEDQDYEPANQTLIKEMKIKIKKSIAVCV